MSDYATNAHEQQRQERETERHTGRRGNRQTDRQTDVAIADPADRQQVNVMSQQQQQQHCEVPQATPILIFMLRIPIQQQLRPVQLI